MCWNKGRMLRKYARPCGHICVYFLPYSPMYMVSNISSAILAPCEVFVCVLVHECICVCVCEGPKFHIYTSSLSFS